MHDGRRSFLKWLTSGIFGVIGAAVAAPALALLGHPLRKKTIYGGEDPLPVARLDQLPEGVPVAVKVNAPVRRDAWLKLTDVPLGAVWLVRQGSSVRAFSSTCPHAGCFVDYEAKKECFACPCHGSVFGIDGARLEGPSPRAMDTLETEVREGQVLVRFQRFRQATADKVPV